MTPDPITTLADLRAYDEAGPRLVDWEGTGDPAKLPPPPEPPKWSPPRPPRGTTRRMHIGSTTITLADVCMVVIAVFVVLAYFNGWGTG